MVRISLLCSKSFFIPRLLLIFFHAGLTKDVILRPSSGEEGNKSPVPKPGEDKKRKVALQSEDPKPKPRRVRRKILALTMDSIQKLRDGEEEEEENASALTVRPRTTVKINPRIEEAPEKKSGKDLELPEVEVVSRTTIAIPDGAGSETPKVDQSIPSDLLGVMTVGHSPSLPAFSEEALREALELKAPDISRGSGVGDPFRDCFTGVDDASDLSDASILLEEAQRLLSRVRIYCVDLRQTCAVFRQANLCFPLLCRPLSSFELTSASLKPSSKRSRRRRML